MTIERKRFLYDITLRFGPSGFRGAHAIDLDQICDGDEVISEKETAARSITEVEFRSLLGGQTAELIEAADSARRDRDIRVAEALNRQDEAEKKQNSAELQLKSKEAELSATKAKLDETKAALDAVVSEFNKLVEKEAATADENQDALKPADGA
jgi:chromosome segregation ATPase